VPRPAHEAAPAISASVDLIEAMPVFQCIVRVMSENEPMQKTLADIATRVDQLVELCRRLSEENRSLRQSQEQLASERAGLMARNEQARARVEAMIGRLKSLEQNQA
jgi:cell division protein ZapB